MRRLGAQFAIAAMLVSAGFACTPTVRQRVDRGYVVTAEPRTQAPPESHEPQSTSSSAGATVAEPSSAPAVAAGADKPADDVEREPTAPESRTDEAAAPIVTQAPKTVVASVPAAELPELFRLDRGPGAVAIAVPRDETLVYEVHLNLGWLGSPTVGKVTMTASVTPFYSDELGHAAGEQAQLSGCAEGSYKVYTLLNTISATLLPQEWPRLIHRNVQTGTENRTRELMFGSQDDKEVSRYRTDSHCKGCKLAEHYLSGTWPWQEAAHCKKCKRSQHRIWRDPRTREIPAGTLDMLSAVFLARSMVLDGRERIEFPLVDREALWTLQLTRGKTAQIETSAGKFDVVAIELRTSAPEGTAGSETTKFEGLFGIHGTISIWAEANSGVPIRIDGTVPAGPIELDVTIELRSARGTPSAFAVLH